MNEIINIVDQLAQGGGNVEQSDMNKWNQTVGSAPQNQFANQVTQALGQVDPNEYAQHVTPGAGGTNPLGTLNKSELVQIAEALIPALLSNSNKVTVQQQTGVSNLDPSSISHTDLASLLQFAQQNAPQVLGQVAGQFQNRPDVLQSILGNKALMSTVTGMGMQFLESELGQSSQASQATQAPQAPQPSQGTNATQQS
jgi:hypothetical protein